MNGWGKQRQDLSYEIKGGVSPPGSGSGQYDYASAIDPALEAATPSTAASNILQPTTSGMPTFRDD